MKYLLQKDRDFSWPNHVFWRPLCPVQWCCCCVNPGWGKTQILQNSGIHSCKTFHVNALTWQISCNNLARFVSSCKILARFLSSCRNPARFKYSHQTFFHRLTLLKEGILAIDTVIPFKTEKGSI